MYKMISSSRRTAHLFLRRLNQAISYSSYRETSRFAYPQGSSAYEDNYVEKAQYPEPNYETRKFAPKRLHKYKRALEWHKSIRYKDTVEEKLIEMNIMRRYGWRCFVLSEDKFDYDCLSFHKHITRTHLFPESQLPEIYNDPKLNEKVEHYANKFHHIFQDIVKFELEGIDYIKEENETPAQITQKKAQSIVNQVSRLLLQALSIEESGLLDAQVDYMPKCEAFWFAGGFEPCTKIKYKRKKTQEFLQNRSDLEDVSPDSPIEEAFQYIGTPLVQVRTKYLNPTFGDENLVSDFDTTAIFSSPPQTFGHSNNVRYGCNIPGHWAIDPYKNNLLSFHSSHFLNFNRAYDIPDELNSLRHPAWLKRVPDLLKSQAVLISFGHLVAQAYILGFDQFSDITYPMTTQSVITDGNDWSFYSYQLNTMQIGELHWEKNKKLNYCWSTPSMKIVDENGNVNLDVLKMLLKFCLLQTVSAEKRLVETPRVKFPLDHLTDDLTREFMLFNLHEMYSLKAETIYKWQKPEIYNWEKIYKIWNKTRPREPLKRFFEIPGDSVYAQIYRFKNPRYKPKRLKFLLGELEKKKEQDAIDELKEKRKTRFIAEDEDSMKE